MPIFVIDGPADRAARYVPTHAIVAFDVFRATTTVVTAVAAGHRVFPVASLNEAARMRLLHPLALQAGELGGHPPDGFELNNSPTALLARSATSVILLSSSGTRLLCNSTGAEATYAGSLRNLRATARHVAASHSRVALIAAGTKGKMRAEDELGAAWLGAALAGLGWRPEDEATRLEVERWRDYDTAQLRLGPSANYLRETEQAEDIDFVIDHVNDLDLVVAIRDGEAVGVRVETLETA